MTVLKLVGVAAGAVAMAGLAMPAQAQAQERWRPSREVKKDKFDLGDAIVGGLVVGGVLALISSGKKKAHDVAPAEERVPIDTGPVEESRYGEPAQPGGGPIAETPAPDSARFDGLYDEDAAADRCAMETETLGERHARLARVSNVTSTVWNGKSWVIKGQVELANSYRDTNKQSHGFRCSLRRGSEPVVTIDGVGGETES
ncbi:hypothetical protein J2W22_002048 [Sphingomonas kyeonggiensis]|uniref:hypothetical protein n=1 Tax=Sphingomonas kyeonggiensis TaxID=1268553 RepID=UPI00278B6D88|nr:hypothetical protein [Sphingomonas kyeonggiensis]MDQ0249984.1 hypothetical protein [Sphingomonas kyeonggiensis]